MHRGLKIIASAVVSLSLAATPVAGSASAPARQAPQSSWLTLSMLTPSEAAALSSVGFAAAQPEPAPPPQGYEGNSFAPPLPVIIVWLGVIGLDIYLLTKHDHHHHTPNSPA